MKTRKLIDQLTSKNNIRRAWERLNKNPRSHGIDNVDISDFRERISDNLKSIRSRLTGQKFKFKPLRGRLIDKDGSKNQRPLRIAAIDDRVVQRAILNVIERRFKKYNLRCSYAYIEGKSRDDAIQKINDLRSRGYVHVLESDIINFFESIDRKILLDKVFSELPDTSINTLLEESLNTIIGNPGEFTAEQIDQYFKNGEFGISQGGILSPLFSNIYLHEFDSFMSKNHRFNLIRYADDFIVLCKSENVANKAYELAKSFLKDRLKLNIHALGAPESKTRITTFANGFDFLGVNFNHDKILPRGKSRLKLTKKISRLLDIKDTRFKSLPDSLVRLRLTLLGWLDSYAICHEHNLKHGHNDFAAVAASVDGHTKKELIKMLKKCELRPSRLGGYHWKLLGVPSLVHELPKIIIKRNKRRQHQPGSD